MNTLSHSSTPTHSSSETLKSRLEASLSQAWQTLGRDPEAAAAPARESEHLARQMGNNHGWAQSLFIWGVSALYAGQAHDAITLLGRALAVYRFVGDEEGQWNCLSAIAKAWHYMGDTEEALATQAAAASLPHHELFATGATWLEWFREF
ncbi:MAG: hypothetical protein C4331_07570 [Meiothermus sp.]